MCEHRQKKLPNTNFFPKNEERGRHSERGCISTQTYLTWVDEHNKPDPLEPTTARSHIEHMLPTVSATNRARQ